MLHINLAALVVRLYPSGQTWLLFFLSLLLSCSNASPGMAGKNPVLANFRDAEAIKITSDISIKNVGPPYMGGTRPDPVIGRLNRTFMMKAHRRVEKGLSVLSSPPVVIKPWLKDSVDPWEFPKRVPGLGITPKKNIFRMTVVADVIRKPDRVFIASVIHYSTSRYRRSKKSTRVKIVEIKLTKDLNNPSNNENWEAAVIKYLVNELDDLLLKRSIPFLLMLERKCMNCNK